MLAADEAFSGLSYDKGMVICSPELLGSVAKDLEKESGVLKQLRKSREERDVRVRKHLVAEERPRSSRVGADPMPVTPGAAASMISHVKPYTSCYDGSVVFVFDPK